MIDNSLTASGEAKDSVIIYSGGLDSTTLLYEMQDSIALAVTFDYGSNHAQHEISCAQEHCRRLGIEHLVIPLPFIKNYFTSSLIDCAEAIPEGSYDDESMRSTVVPFRNGIMMSIACGIAESRNLRHVLIANHGGDHAIYPDCRAPFIDAMSQAMHEGTYIGVDIVAPYTHLSKSDIVRRGTAFGINYGTTYSCYKGGALHCGKCGTCQERKEAFKLAGVVDPTQYED